MNTKKSFAIALLLMMAAGAVVQAQDSAADHMASMEAWNKAATPGAFHEFLGTKAGSWHIRGKMWTTPDAEPMTTESDLEAKMILGGRYLMETMKGESMGMPFEGMGITGYDNTSGVITSVWYDNMGTATTVLTGTGGKPGDPMELTGSLIDPMSGQEMAIRTLTTYLSPDKTRFEYFTAMEGMPEIKVMELDYSRAE